MQIQVFLLQLATQKLMIHILDQKIHKVWISQISPLTKTEPTRIYSCIFFVNNGQKFLIFKKSGTFFVLESKVSFKIYTFVMYLFFF